MSVIRTKDAYQAIRSLDPEQRTDDFAVLDALMDCEIAEHRPKLLLDLMLNTSPPKQVLINPNIVDVVRPAGCSTEIAVSLDEHREYIFNVIEPVEEVRAQMRLALQLEMELSK